MQSIEQRKQSLSYAAIMRNLTTMTPDEQSRLVNGLNEVPVHRIYTHAQYIQNQLLPRVERSKGLDSEEYKHFKAIHDTMIWCIHIMDLQERILLQLSNERLQVEFYREKTIFYERELQRYTTQEELLFAETSRACARAITRGAINRMTTTSSNDQDTPL